MSYKWYLYIFFKIWFIWLVLYCTALLCFPLFLAFSSQRYFFFKDLFVSLLQTEVRGGIEVKHRELRYPLRHNSFSAKGGRVKQIASKLLRMSDREVESVSYFRGQSPVPPQRSLTPCATVCIAYARICHCARVRSSPLVSFLLAAWQLALLKIDCHRPFHGLHVLLSWSQSGICHEWRKQNETLYDCERLLVRPHTHKYTHLHSGAIRTHKHRCMLI